MRCLKTATICWMLTLTCLVLSTTSTWAAKPDNPGGGPGGGGSGPSYEIVELDNVDGMFHCTPQDINNSGLVVGWIGETSTDAYFAAAWTIDKSGGEVTTTLHPLAARHFAHGVNELGEIVGMCDVDPDWDLDAVYWEHLDAEPIVLPKPEGYPRCAALNINNDGVVCGWADIPLVEGGFESVAVVWRIRYESVDGEPTPVVFGPVVLPNVDPDASAHAFAINDNAADSVARVVGQALRLEGQSNGNEVPVTWEVMSLSDGTLLANPLPEVLASLGVARGINNANETCGSLSPVQFQWDGVVWSDDSTTILDRSATIRTFGGRKPFQQVHPQAISNTGVIVGMGYVSAFTKALVWPSEDAPMIVLDDFIKRTNFTSLNVAHAVNDSGEIVGWGWDGERDLYPGFLALPR